MAVRTGLEPATSCVTGRHSNQLNYRTRLRGQDLNLRPSGYEPDELPNCSTPRQYYLCDFFHAHIWHYISQFNQRSTAPISERLFKQQLNRCAEEIPSKL